MPGHLVAAADSAHSPIRERLGIRQLGHGELLDSIQSTSRRMCAARWVDPQPERLVHVFGPHLQGFFRFSIDLQAGLLVVNSTVDENGT